MAQSKYAHLVKTMPVNKGEPTGANARELIWIYAKDLENIPVNFAIGRYEETGLWHTWAGPHTHPKYDESLIFFGHDPDRLDYLGAEFEIALGEEQEKHIIDKPCLVLIPKGLPHCPLYTNRIDSSFAHGHIILGPDENVDWWPTDYKSTQTTDGNKYSHLIKPLKVQKNPQHTDLTWKTSDQLEGFNMHMAAGLCTETGAWYPGKGAHTHPYDKLMIFIGTHPEKLGYLGAEIEIALGKEGEKVTFDLPTVITVPKDTPHWPPVVKKIEKTFGFIIYNLAPQHELSWVE